MNDLEILGKKYGTDKIGKHNYLPYYYEMFKGKKEDTLNLLEIGVGEGAGLYMWREFFPYANIYGADNDLRRVFYQPSPKQIQVYQCDQSSDRDLEKLVKKTTPFLDIVIDDGSHKPEDRIFTCLKMMGELLEGEVTYVIEDVADPDIAKMFYHYDTEVIRCGERYDDTLIVVKHKYG